VIDACFRHANCGVNVAKTGFHVVLSVLIGQAAPIQLAYMQNTYYPVLHKRKCRKIMSEDINADQIERVELLTATRTNRGKEHDWTPNTSRWTKGDHDRLYFNDSKYVDYVDLTSGFGHREGSAVDISTELNGDELSVSVEAHEKTYSVTFKLHGLDAEDGEEADSELIADGGEDPSEIVTDEEITSAIERNDDPDHPEAATVAEVRDTLAAINADTIAALDLHEDAIDEGAHEIVHEDAEKIVLADQSGHFWTEQFDALGINDDILRSIIISLHHTAARKECEHSWSTVAPVVIVKPQDTQQGEQHVLREIARRTDELGSVARAVDTLAVETHDWQQSMWANVTGRNDSVVSRTTNN